MDAKVVLKFIADVLYIKGYLSVQELSDVYDASSFSDLDKISEKMMCGDYNNLKRGEGYVRQAGIDLIRE